MLETPMSSVVTQNMPSVVRQTIPHYVLAAFQEKAGDHLHQYALLNKPMWCSDDSQYIGELLNKLTCEFFPKQAGECLAWIMASHSLQQTSG